MSRAYRCDLCGEYFDGRGSSGWPTWREVLHPTLGFVQFRVSVQIVDTAPSIPELCSICVQRVIKAAMNNERIVTE